jgi:hypothetical protein
MGPAPRRTQSSETRLASSFAALYRSRLARWTERERRALARALIAVGDTFTARRLLQRLERGELGSFDDCVSVIVSLEFRDPAARRRWSALFAFAAEDARDR